MSRLVVRQIDPADLDVFCKILLNETFRARTTAKKGIGSPERHEALFPAHPLSGAISSPSFLSSFFHSSPPTTLSLSGTR